jgi:hypothetical protein
MGIRRITFLTLALALGLSAVRTSAAAENRVLDLDGNGAHVELPAGMFDNLAAITIEGWVKWASFTESSRFFDFVVNGEVFKVQSWKQSPGLFLETLLKNGGRQYLLVPHLLRTNEWVHVAAVSAPEGRKLYLNGTVASDAVEGDSVTRENPTNTNFLGKPRWEQTGWGMPTRTLHGSMDEVRVGNVARSEAEIRNAMFQRLKGDEPALIGLWHFDDGTAKDSSASRRDGTLKGSARIVPAAVPTTIDERFWSRLKITARDRSGTGLRDVAMQLQVAAAAMTPPFSVTSGEDPATCFLTL